MSFSEGFVLMFSIGTVLAVIGFGFKPILEKSSKKRLEESIAVHKERNELRKVRKSIENGIKMSREYGDTEEKEELKEQLKETESQFKDLNREWVNLRKESKFINRLSKVMLILSIIGCILMCLAIIFGLLCLF